MIDWDKLEKLEESMSPVEDRVIDECLKDSIKMNSNLECNIEAMSRAEVQEVYWLFRQGWLACRTFLDGTTDL